MHNHTNKTERARLSLGQRVMVLIAAIFTAIAVAVTCALCFKNSEPIAVVDNVDGGEVTTSTAYSNSTTNFATSGTLNNGDTITYSYKGSSYSVTLPKGQYTFTVNGAQGGQGCNSGGTGAGTAIGGKGGKVVATYNLTAASTVLYIYVGGAGTNCTSKTGTAGGWNGGGSGGSSSTCGGAGGGGASDIRIGGTALSNRIIVAGGGGGASWNAAAVGGAGGGTTGGTGGNNSSTAATGGTQSGGGSGYSAGTLGTGGTGQTSTSSVINGGCGGGGGYYGGASSRAAASGTCSGGGGGSSYAGSTTACTIVGTAAHTQGAQTGNGSIVISVVSVNQKPEAKSKTTQTVASSLKRANPLATAVAVNASAIAQDPEGGAVYFTNGTATNLDTFTTTANTGLFLDSGCSTLATDYISWTWTNNTQFKITAVKRYPRASSTTGCTLDGRLTLYARFRDTFGSTTTRGWAIIPFYITISDNNIANKTTTFQKFTKTSGSVSYEYRFGNSTSTSTTLDYVSNASSIYCSAAVGTKTVFLPKPISPTDTTGYTIYAEDLYSDTDATTFDYVAFKTATLTTAVSGTGAAVSNAGNYYTVTYNSNTNYASGLYPSITVKSTGVRPSGAVFVTMTLTAQSSERVSKLAIGGTNTTIRLTFRIANTRPYFASSTAINGSGLSEPVIELNPNETKTLALNTMIRDLDDASLTATFARGTNDLKLPTYEYIQVDASNVAVPLQSNVGSNYYGKATVRTSGTLSSASGEGNEATGFVAGVIAAAGSAAASTASVTYSYTNATTISFTARAATHYMYSDKASTVHSRKGDFYVLVRVIDPSDTADTGLWYPIAIKVKPATPKEPTTVANVKLDWGTTYVRGEAVSNGYAGKPAEQNTAPSVVLTPISYLDASGNVIGIGTTGLEFGGITGHAKPMLIDADSFAYTGTNAYRRPLNDFALLDGVNITDGTLGSSVTLYDTANFFSVEAVPLYVHKDVVSKLQLNDTQLRTFGLVKGEGSYGDAYKFYGLKITPIRSTGDEYFQFSVNVKDSVGAKSTVRICVNVPNRALSARMSPYTEGTPVSGVDPRFPINNAGGAGTYKYNSGINKVALDYKIERNDVIQITPYDLVYDFDIDPTGQTGGFKLNPNGGLNTNPKDAGFDTAARYITKTYSVPHTSSVASPAAAATAVTAQQLTINKDNFATMADQYKSYVTATVEDYCMVGAVSYAIPCVKIVGVSRTTSAVVQLRFTISDGFDVIECTVTVTVNNSAPVLNTAANHPVVSGSGDTKRVEPLYRMVVDPINSIDPSVVLTQHEFSAQELAYDKDDDTPVFVGGSAQIVAKVGDKYYTKLGAGYVGAVGEDGVTVEGVNVVYDLADYVDVIITKDSSGIDVVRVTALSSTLLIDKEIYLSVQVNDGFRAQPQTSTLYVRIEVVNSKPTFGNENLVMSEGKYFWNIPYEETAELAQPRYIVSSKELYDSSIIPAMSTNKIWLFDDADAQQHVLLNPNTWNADTTTTLVAKSKAAGGTTTNSADLVTKDLFETTVGKNAAVIYNSTYNMTGVVEDDRYLNITVEFFTRSADGVFSVYNSNTDGSVSTAYWALRIVDGRGTDTAASQTHIAIRFKDDHDGKTLNFAGSKPADESSSDIILDFYYVYQGPGVTAMHSYYRTDGYAEREVALEGGDYLVDYKGIVSTQLTPNKTVGSQDELRAATFVDKFKYQYFVRSYKDGSNIVYSYKRYRETQGKVFEYKPIEVGDLSVDVPISYIAMPSANPTSDTHNNNHITFANAGVNKDASNPLKDGEYLSWGPLDANVFANLTLSDGTGKEWKGLEINKSPYITIEYIKKTAEKPYIDGDYLNADRFTIGDGGSGIKTVDWQIKHGDVVDGSIFREDEFGFKISRQTNPTYKPVRAPGLLKLTVALKRVNPSNPTDVSNISYVDVEIGLTNSKPSGVQTDNGAASVNLDMVKKVNGQTVAAVDPNGKTVALTRTGGTVGDFQITYEDRDTTDTMKFYLPSATGTLSEAEYNRANLPSTCISGAAATAITNYTKGWTHRSAVTEGDTTTVTTPNPGYQKFFDVSPSVGAATMLSFTPNNKTQLNSTDDATLAKYNLKKDTATGRIYYPFRVLFYDECNNSAFTEGYWCLATINVYIANDTIHTSDKVTEVHNKLTYNGKLMPKYSFTLSKNTDYFVDVTSLLEDNDLLYEGASYAVSDDEFSDEQKLTKDYLIMPDSYLSVYRNDTEVTTDDGIAGLPVTVKKPAASTGMSKTMLQFNAACAFNGTVEYVYEFQDSAESTPVRLVFSAKYSNEAPTLNSDTFGGRDTINIIMKTGDYFTLYAADYNKFSADAKGGFISSGANFFDDRVDGNYSSFFDGKTAESMREAFLTFDSVAAYESSKYMTQSKVNLGELVLGSDDAASTLRIVGLSDEYDDVLKIDAKNEKRTEQSAGMYGYMRLVVTAIGVVDTTFAVTLEDSNGSAGQLKVNLNITVVSVPPTPKDVPLATSGLTKVADEVGVYSLELNYGAEKEIALSSFMDDADRDDDQTLSVYRNTDGTYYDIKNPEGSTNTVTAENGAIYSTNTVKLTANDFINVEGRYSTVTFRVSDRHGSVSEPVTFRVYVKPRDVSVTATAAEIKPYSAIIESYAEYERTGEPARLAIVAPSATATVFADDDANATSARYNVVVYALLKDNGNETFSSIRRTSKDFSTETCRLVSFTGSSLDSNMSSSIYGYVSRFFTINITDNGKTMLFTPNSATLSATSTSTELSKISLLIQVSKRYTYTVDTGSGDPVTATTKTAQEGYIDVSVQNSELVAVENSPFNAGLPMIPAASEDEEPRMRDSAFLSFTGTAGDELTWDLYNLTDRDYGLFYDYDLIRNPARTNEAGEQVGGLETITYVRSSYSVTESVTGKGDVLSVTSVDNRTVKIKINRKVYTGQPAPDGNTVSYTEVPVDIYCADTLGRRKGVTNDKNLVKTTIMVRIENDVPEIKRITDAATVEELGYSITYNDFDGYVLDAALEKGKSLALNIKDFIDDRDINMDEYVLLYTGSDESLMGSDGNLMGSTVAGGANDGIGRIKKNNETLFTARLTKSTNNFSVSTLSRILFTCESFNRGAVGTCYLKFRDSVRGAETRVLTVNLTVDNIAPTVDPSANLNVTVMGVGKTVKGSPATPDDVIAAVKSFNILDYITDANGDDFDANAPENSTRRSTYAYIDEILVYTKADPINPPQIYGPYATETDGTDQWEPAQTVCAVNWNDADAKHQSFSVIPSIGIYGVQKVMFAIVDSGYEDGSAERILDGKRYSLTLTITVANPLDEVAEVLAPQRIAYGVTRSITVEDLLGEDQAYGYEIASIEEVGSNSLTYYKPGESGSATGRAASTDSWRIYARTEGARVNAKVTFKAGDATVTRTLPIEVISNNAPTFKEEKTSYSYTTGQLDDKNKRTIRIYPEDWFNDVDADDIMNFVTPVTSSQTVKVDALYDYDESGRAYLLLTFNRRGKADITVNVTDLSGNLYERTITVECTDAPELSWWENVVSLIEANWMWFWIIVGCFLLFLILLIILIIVIHKKRKMRREIEALLNSETELEEEMMMLSAGGMAPYQSYGYLPPTQNTVYDPTLMLGGSAANPTPNSLQLNAGTGRPAPGQPVPPPNGAQQMQGTPMGGQINNVPPPQSADGFDPNDF